MTYQSHSYCRRTTHDNTFFLFLRKLHITPSHRTPLLAPISHASPVSLSLTLSLSPQNSAMKTQNNKRETCFLTVRLVSLATYTVMYAKGTITTSMGYGVLALDARYMFWFFLFCLFFFVLALLSASPTPRVCILGGSFSLRLSPCFSYGRRASNCVCMYRHAYMHTKKDEMNLLQ